MEKVTFVQFSDKLLTSDSIMREYYSKAYSRMDGYYFPEHFMEIPYWIPIIDGMLPKDKYETSLHIVENVEKSAEALSDKKPEEKLLMSVMDTNEVYVKALIDETDKQVILGGYTDPSHFSVYPNVKYLNSLDNLSEILEINPNNPPDYSLFAGLKCIPRLTLSTGCLFRCTFCTVPTILQTVDSETVSSQVESMKPLDFKLIFIDDKSFGQAKNWETIKDIGEQVKGYNPEFQGFIVQTPPSIASKSGFLEKCVEFGVKYIELGVEVVDDELLIKLNKSYRVKQLDAVCEKARKLGIKIIPNLIFGIPGDDYQKTIEWIRKNLDIIPVVNANYLSVHHGNERGKLHVESKGLGDQDQNSPDKSWLSEDDAQKMRDALEEIYKLTSGN